MNTEPVFLDYIAMLHELNQRANEQGVRGFELIDGDFIRMQSEPLWHAVAKRRIADLLDAAVPKCSPCRAFVDGPTVVSRTDNGMIANQQAWPQREITSLRLVFPFVRTTVKRDTLSAAEARRLLHYPVPVFLIGQLTVDRSVAGMGYGGTTLVSALRYIAECIYCWSWARS